MIPDRRATLGMLIGVAVAFTAFGCSSSTEPKTEGFTVLVDSISAPELAVPGEPFLVRVWAQVGPDLCHAFDRFDVEWKGQEAHVTVLGTRETGENLECPTALAEMQGVGLAINPPAHQDVVLVFQKRGGGEIRQTVKAG